MRAKIHYTIIVFVIATLLVVPLEGAFASDCARTSVGLLPLNDLGTNLYQNKQGGLYPGGSNFLPAAHSIAGLQLAHLIRPLDVNGQPSNSGKIVFVSIGMSNTTQEFSTFKPLADADPDKNPKLVIVDGAQGGMTAARIADPNSSTGVQFWQTVDQRLTNAGVTPAQVQVAWVKQADAGPTLAFPNDAITLKDELALITQTLKQRFPNIRLTYFSSRIYAGYASTTLNPEPYAYQSGFAVKWLIEDQMNGSPNLNFDSTRGQVNAPWIAWGPYLWADGMTQRSDGLTYTCADFVSDGTHPAVGGARTKVAQSLLTFLKTDTTARVWFLDPARFATLSLVAETNTDRAIGLTSVTMLREPFSVTDPFGFAADQRNRVLLVADNLDLLPGEDASAVTAQAEDAQHRLFNLSVEYVGSVPGLSWLSEVIVKLPDELNGAGDVQVTISLRGQTSNKLRITVGSQ